MKRTAVLLFPLISVYEISVTLSVLGQAKKPMTFFSAGGGPVCSEEGLPLMAQAGLDDVDIDEFDSLLISGSMNPWESYLDDGRCLPFVKRFDDPAIRCIGAISSGPILLSMNGMLAGRDYTCGVPEELFEKLGFDPSRYRQAACVDDGPILTAPGWHYVDFGIRFGERLGLEFDPGWYRK